MGGSSILVGLRLRPEVEAALRREAALRGQHRNEYIRSILGAAVRPLTPEEQAIVDRAVSLARADPTKEEP
jgi:hypothetical protein